MPRLGDIKRTTYGSGHRTAPLKDELDQRALAAGLITLETYAALGEANEAPKAVVQMDAFDINTYR